MKTINNNMLRAGLIAVIVAVILPACGIYKKYETPTDVPIIDLYERAIRDTSRDNANMGNLPWRAIFTDPLLQSYIERALANNVDLKNAKLNIDIAEARLLGAKLSYLPAVNFAPNGAGVKFGDDNPMDWGWQLPLTVSWQVDIFAQITNNKRSKQSLVIQTQAYRQAVQSQIIASVATCYYQLVSLYRQLDIYNENVGLWENTIKLMKDMKEAGRYTEVAVVQGEANYYSVLATIPDIQLSITNANNTLSLLLNEQPAVWEVNTDSKLWLPDNIADGIPVSYLATRPDVRAAEQDFAQAYYATNVARANFYPNLTINGTFAYGTLFGSTVLDAATWLINLAGTLTQPIFNRGANIATFKAAKLQQQQALNNFQHTIINAYNEASTTMASIRAYHEKEINVQQQKNKLEQAVDFNKDLMQYATTTYLEVITAQQSLLAAQIQLENVRLNNNLNIIDLYQILGGGR